MSAERKSLSSGLRPGPALSEFIKKNIEIAKKAGLDPEIATFRALLDANKSGKIDELIESDISADIKNIDGSSTSSH